MLYNYSKLRGAIKEKYNTQYCFANALGLSERTLSLKLCGKINWKQKEIIRACDLLKIPYEKITTYFFEEKVQ